jgi:DNA segregation ATPase FtsK/SpoIIIE-like protein
MSAVLLEQSATKICFKVEFPIGSIQIIGTSDGKNLLGMGDCLYRSAQTFAIERLQTVFYTDEELQELCGKLKYASNFSSVPTNPPQPIKEDLPKYIDLTKKYIKPETTEWKILSLIRDSGKKLSGTAVAKEFGLTKNLEYVNATLELFYTNGLIHREKSRNGLSWVYFR